MARLDALAAENAVAVAVDKQREHHPRREMLAAATAFVEAELLEIHETDRFEDEVGHVIAATHSRRSTGKSIGVSRSMLMNRAGIRFKPAHAHDLRKVRQTPNGSMTGWNAAYVKLFWNAQ